MAKGGSQAGLEMKPQWILGEELMNDSSISKQQKGLERKSPTTFPEMTHEFSFKTLCGELQQRRWKVKKN